VNVDEFERVVTDRTDFETREEVFTGADAVLRTLSHRISGGAAADFAEHFPDPLAEAVAEDDDTQAESFGPNAFVELVADRERAHGELDSDKAGTHVRAVFQGIDKSVNDEAWREVKAQLPSAYGNLFDFDRNVDEAS
jgi:uncharacterized protein (DUF2267 family)